MKKLSFKMTLKDRDAWIGRSFILPWLIGFLYFFLYPMIESIIYSFGKISFEESGISLEFVKFENYIYLLAKDPDYIRQMVESFVNLAYELPIISIYSLFIAIILNQKFKGRVFARVLFFMPVIVASGVVIEMLKKNGMNTTLGRTMNAYIYQDEGIQQLMQQYGFNQSIIDFTSQLVNRIFDISWKSGIQILLYLAGLQTIPASYYEVSQLEGASAWETFWKVTFPIVSPVSLVCVIYTVIDSFTYKSNPVMVNIYNAFSELRIGQSEAGSWLYFLIIFIVLGAIIGLLSRVVFYNEE